MSDAGGGPELLFRRAEVRDAEAVAALYVASYTPEGGGDARDHYPFPQVLDPDGVAGMIAGGAVAWVVAEAGGEIVASAAAVCNIGSEGDRVAEVFGVVVAPGRRQGHVGSRLVGRLVAALDPPAAFVLCEARTAEPGGWGVARNAGFVPIGFEPYAHAMPVGFESMVLTARGDWAGRVKAAPGAALTPRARRVAAAVLGPSAAVPPVARAAGPVSPPPRLSVRRDDEAGRAMFVGAGGAFEVSHEAGVIDFHPLQGKDRDGRRYDHPYLVGLIDGRLVGAVRVVVDRVDARTRVLGLRASDASIASALLSTAVARLEAEAAGGALVTLVSVRADAPRLQAALEARGFLPTAYYPGLVASPAGRLDALQYTRLTGRSLAASIRGVTALDWPEAALLIRAVVGGGDEPGPP